MSRTRVVITGIGQISPLGIGIESLSDCLRERKSGVGHLQRIPVGKLPTSIGGEAHAFTGHIDDFGPLEKMTKRSIKKGLKLMCREIEMGVAAAQWAISNSGIEIGKIDPERIGCVFGSDYIMTVPQEFSDAVNQCRNGDEVDFGKRGEQGLPKVEPLWLLKYLPNMPASHVAIYNDLRGPSNSLTVREASSNMAIAEAFTTIGRGAADMIVCGSTGSRIHPLRSVHTSLQEPVAQLKGVPETSCRPFDKDRSGMVIGEGAGSVLLESLDSAQRRNAKIYGEVVGFGSSTVASKTGMADFETAFFNVIDTALSIAGMNPQQIGHVHAHGLSTIACDEGEAKAIQRACPDRPVTALKSYMGNLGAGSGMVELIASLVSIDQGSIIPLLNYETPDAACPIQAATDSDQPGDSFINLNITPQGQASAVVVKSFSA